MSTRRSVHRSKVTTKNVRSAVSRKKDRGNSCSFTFVDGRRCRTPLHSGHPHLCYFHARKEAQARAAEDIAFFLSSDYLSACDLTLVLGRVFAALAKGHIKPKTAATFAYLGQTLLQTIQSAEHEYMEAMGPDGWLTAVYSNIKQNEKRIYPPAPQEPPQPAAPAPKPVPVSQPAPANHPEPAALASAPQTPAEAPKPVPVSQAAPVKKPKPSASKAVPKQPQPAPANHPEPAALASAPQTPAQTPKPASIATPPVPQPCSGGFIPPPLTQPQVPPLTPPPSTQPQPETPSTPEQTPPSPSHPASSPPASPKPAPTSPPSANALPGTCFK